MLHHARIEQRWKEWGGQLRESVDERVNWARLELAQDDSAERRPPFKEYFAASEAQLENGFASALEMYLGELHEPDGDGPLDGVLEAEREVVGRLHEELVSAPLLAYLREQVEALIGE